MGVTKSQSSRPWVTPDTMSRDRPSPQCVLDPSHKHGVNVVLCHKAQGGWLCRNDWISTQNKRQRLLRKPEVGMVCQTLSPQNQEGGMEAVTVWGNHTSLPEAAGLSPSVEVSGHFSGEGWVCTLYFLVHVQWVHLDMGASASSWAELASVLCSLQGLNPWRRLRVISPLPQRWKLHPLWV